MKEQVTIFIWRKKLSAFYIHPGQILVNFFFSNYFFSCFEWKYCAVSQNVIFMSFIYLHFSNFKFLTFCSIDWFRFQKPFAIGPFRIPRCQDFWDKSLVWFLGFQYRNPFLKGVTRKTRPPETLKCSKSKTCIAEKLKLHQSVYLIR